MQQADFEELLADTLAAYGRSPRTQETCTLIGRCLGRPFIGKTLDTVAPEDIEVYQRYLVTERKVGFSSFNQSTCALRFFYRTCLGKTEWPILRMPYQRKRRTLPEILAPEELVTLFEACTATTRDASAAVADPVVAASPAGRRGANRSKVETCGSVHSAYPQAPTPSLSLTGAPCLRAV